MKPLVRLAGGLLPMLWVFMIWVQPLFARDAKQDVQEVGCTNGTLSSGLWATPITSNGQSTTGNAPQYYASAWQVSNDAGTLTQGGFPFLVYGTVGTDIYLESIIDHVTSAYTASISNEGNIGYINGFPGQGGVGNGFTFNGGQRLFEGGLMVGVDSTRVSDGARDEAQLFDADFQFLANIDTTINGTTTAYTTSYNDALAEIPIGLRIDQATFSFNEAGKNNIMIVQLDLVNETGDNLSGVVAGAYFDWDVAATANDRGAVIVDSLNSIPEVNGGEAFPFDLVEIHHPGARANAYMGVVPLDTSNFYGRRVAIQQTEVYPPHMTDGDKWRYMTTLRSTNPNGDGGSSQDHGAVFGIGPYNILAVDQSIRVGFALVAGTTLQACVDAAQEAQRIWVQELGNTLRAPFSTADVSVDVSPDSGDGIFDFHLRIENTSDSSLTADVWTEFVKSNGRSKLGDVFYDRTLGPNQTYSKSGSEHLGANAPPGEYDFVVNVGTYPDSVIASGRATYTKVAGLDKGGSAATGMLPETFELFQNHPNPFNPSTTIRYGLPEQTQVRLEVISLLGERVALLVDGVQAAGYHEVTFDASNLSSGVYLYRIRADRFVATRKFMLLR